MLFHAEKQTVNTSKQAQFNAWRQVGQLPASDSISLITAIPKGSAAPASCNDLRGIAVGTLPAKVYASVLERRASDWAEASGSIRASGQFGFRRKRSTAQAAFVLRTLQEQHRQHGQQLWVCFVDFKQAYDRVQRQLLWQKLASRGFGGEWLRAVQALYADVPMAVRTAAGLSPCFQATVGLKQGCPLSPTLFGLFIDDFEEWVLAAARRGERLDLPLLGGEAMPPLLYADDMALVATSPAGLQAQLDLLQQYCQRWGLTVNTVKTKLLLLSGARTEQGALEAAQLAGLSFGGAPLEAVTSFKYLGIVFSASHALAGTAAPARTQLAGLALSNMRARCAQLGIQAAGVRLQLFSTLVDSVLSYGAEVWAPQLSAKAAASGDGRTGCKAETLCMGFLRQQLGVHKGTPSSVVLAELGERPLWARWLKRSVRLWNRLMQQPPGSILRRALDASLALAREAPAGQQLARRSWAGQLALALEAVGIPIDLHQPRAISYAAVQQCSMERHLQQLAEAATREGATKRAHYVQRVRGGTLDVESYGRAQYVGAVRERARRQALAQLRTGSHWGAEDTGRRTQVTREQRVCPHCRSGIEAVEHMVFLCPQYAPVRARFSGLFAEDHSLCSFLEQQPQEAVAQFAASCRRVWAQATAELNT